ncbi:MAG: hypothetical protein NTY23_01595, partial [Chloroflexi bacterium]|nr:hypothetical protein [Chloroflexota bacterium]
MPVVLEPDRGGQVHTDLHANRRVESQLGVGDSLVALGWGTVTDTAKHAAFLFGQRSGATVP